MNVSKYKAGEHMDICIAIDAKFYSVNKNHLQIYNCFAGNESLPDNLRRKVQLELGRYSKMYTDSLEDLANDVGIDFTAFFTLYFGP